MPADRLLLAEQHADQRRLAAAVGAEQADADAGAEAQVDPLEDRAPVVSLRDPARLDQAARPRFGGGEVQRRGPRQVAAPQLLDLVAERAGAGDARLLLGRAGGRAAPQPLGLAAEGVAQDHLAPLLRVHRLRLHAHVRRVVAGDAEQPARVAAVELEDACRDPLQEQAIVRDRDRREPGPAARQQRLEPLDALDVQVVRGLVEEQQVGLAGEGAADRHALLPPAGQQRDRRVGPEAAARGVERQRREHPAFLLVRVGTVVRGADPLQDRVAHRGAVREARRLVQERRRAVRAAARSCRGQRTRSRPGCAAASICPRRSGR